MKYARCVVVFLFALTFFTYIMFGQEKKLLVDDLSRQALADYAVSLQPGVRALPYYFYFPQDVRPDRAYGIDISHYNGVLKWDQLPSQQISFVYVKASQGANLYDGQFAYNWQAIGALRGRKMDIRRGAYHFMTAKDSPEPQAQNFLGTVGQMNPRDMPPCLDIEWDFLIRDEQYVLDKNGKRIDQWSTLSPAEIVQRLTAWLQAVETATGKRPIIYTSAHWWSQRIGSVAGFEHYSFWMADYSAPSLEREQPLTLPSLSWSMWQLTDKGVFQDGGLAKNVDTTVYNGSLTEFDEFLLNKPKPLSPAHSTHAPSRNRLIK